MTNPMPWRTQQYMDDIAGEIDQITVANLNKFPSSIRLFTIGQISFQGVKKADIFSGSVKKIYRLNFVLFLMGYSPFRFVVWPGMYFDNLEK